MTKSPLQCGLPIDSGGLFEIHESPTCKTRAQLTKNEESSGGEGGGARKRRLN